METSDRAKLREGNSPRAQAYRLKDELLSFSYTDLQKHCEANNLQETVQKKFAVVHEHLKVLAQDENNEEAGTAAQDALRDVHKTLADSGFTFSPKSE